MLRGLGNLGNLGQPSEFPEFESLTKKKTPPYVMAIAVGAGILLLVLIFMWTTGGSHGNDVPFVPPGPGMDPAAMGGMPPPPAGTGYVPPPAANTPPPQPGANPGSSPGMTPPTPAPSGTPASAGITASGGHVASSRQGHQGSGRTGDSPSTPTVRCSWHILNPDDEDDNDKGASAGGNRTMIVSLDITNNTREVITIQEQDFILVTEQAAFPAMAGDNSPVPGNTARIRQLDLAGGMRTSGAVTFQIPADYQGRMNLTWEPSGKRPGNFQLDIRRGAGH